MPERTRGERLQPSLLDRLTDDEPEKKEESRDKRILSMRKLRESVLRDLNWLLNATCLETSEEELRQYPHVRQSTVNYGIRNMTGTTSSNASGPELERLLKKAILDFEPRILPQTLKVRALSGPEDETEALSAGNSDAHRYPNMVAFKIEGELWAQPLPERLFLKTILDLELGSVEVEVDG